MSGSVPLWSFCLSSFRFRVQAIGLSSQVEAGTTLKHCSPGGGHRPDGDTQPGGLRVMSALPWSASVIQVSRASSLQHH